MFQTCDVSIEIGELPDSTQIARLLGMLPAYLYASREYLENTGSPSIPATSPATSASSSARKALAASRAGR